MSTLMPQFEIAQVAYFVDDIRLAAKNMSQTFGAGPFYIVDEIQLEWGEHRGQPCKFVHSSAYGQWGNIMMELVQQDSAGPSPFRDLYAPGQTGLHHVATMVTSLAETYASFASAGIPIATRAQTLSGVEFAFLDATSSMGHFIEVYERSETLVGFYGFIREAAQGWDGVDPARTLSA